MRLSRRRAENIEESAAYDRISKGSRLSDLIVVYDEASILLFERPSKKTVVKKVDREH